MMTLRTARTLTRYSRWANRLTYDCVATLPPEEVVRPRQGLFRNMLHMLNHTYVIDRVFQCHLEGRPHGYAARNTPDSPPLAALRRAQEEVDAWYVAWSDRLTPQAMDEKVAFEYIGGGDGVMTRGEILVHVVNHTTYHRGFVAEMIYRAGVTPQATDFTVFVRDVPLRLD